MALLAACSDDQGNFSQFPGFAEWYRTTPPSEALPDTGARDLLEHYKPRVHLPEGHEGSLDFYRDYIGEGRLYGADGNLIGDRVTAEMLNAWKADPGVTFVHEPGGRPVMPVIYGRLDEAEIEPPGCAGPVPVTFLTYHLAFRHSGLPAALPGCQALLLGGLGDLEDWHQLDHYTAISLALLPAAEGAADGLLPFAVTFQQHNYLRTYLFGSAPAPGRLVLPEDGRLEVDVAIRSNELYPHVPGRTRRRAVSFLDTESAGYLITGADPPWRAADDVTAPARVIDPPLALLPPADAFYVFQGWLGERRLLPGRDGPPGADYNTRPAFKSKAAQLALFYWHEEDRDFLELSKALFHEDTRRAGAAVELDPFAARLTTDGRLAC
jgi:hypothetical protein